MAKWLATRCTITESHAVLYLAVFSVTIHTALPITITCRVMTFIIFFTSYGGIYPCVLF